MIKGATAKPTENEFYDQLEKRLEQAGPATQAEAERLEQAAKDQRSFLNADMMERLHVSDHRLAPAMTMASLFQQESDRLPLGLRSVDNLADALRSLRNGPLSSLTTRVALSQFYDRFTAHKEWNFGYSSGFAPWRDDPVTLNAKETSKPTFTVDGGQSMMRLEQDKSGSWKLYYEQTEPALEDLNKKALLRLKAGLEHYTLQLAAPGKDAVVNRFRGSWDEGKAIASLKKAVDGAIARRQARDDEIMHGVENSLLDALGCKSAETRVVKAPTGFVHGIVSTLRERFLGGGSTVEAGS
jgi:hypothetical protein